MPIKKSGTIWMNGKFVKWDNATIHVLSHVVHYGSSWFEGIRCYDTKKGSAIFQLRPHLERLYDSTKIYHTKIPYTIEILEEVTIKLIKNNKLKSCYIRPVVYRGYGEMGLNPLKNPVEVAIAVWEWSSYLGDESLETGVKACISSWQRLAPNTIPTMSKAGGNYLSSQLIKIEALENGFAEGIALDAYGNVSEGSGENIFLVKNGKVYTPSIADAILPGITRASVIQILKDEGIEIIETTIPREFLMIANEVFVTGTAAEITPVCCINHQTVDHGKPGKITRLVQEKYFDIIKNGNDPHGWLTFIK
ncbi:MAG: branched-chain amino acid transaminase [Bacteroidota bacterium]|nr:branched-chain amino acid transaminase [Bacteroidota bacterium]